MANLTLTVDAEVLKRARIRALEQGTSVNAMVREYLGGVVGENPAGSGVRGFLALAERTSAGSDAGARRWTRDEAHDR